MREPTEHPEGCWRRHLRCAVFRAEELATIAAGLHWMARRYADGRNSYATRLHNDATRRLLSLGVELDPTADGIIWARDGLGRAFDGLSDAEATPGTPEARGEHTQPSKETR